MYAERYDNSTIVHEMPQQLQHLACGSVHDRFDPASSHDAFGSKQPDYKMSGMIAGEGNNRGLDRGCDMSSFTTEQLLGFKVRSKLEAQQGSAFLVLVQSSEDRDRDRDLETKCCVVGQTPRVHPRCKIPIMMPV